MASRVKKRQATKRGKIPISHELVTRPVEAGERRRLGDWEADTIRGKNRKIRFVGNLSKLGDKEVEER